jgi:DNA mismatch endonuclease Vsr
MDRFTEQKRKQIMASIKGRRTRPEKLVRTCLKSLGIRFRGNVKTLPGTPDIVIQGQKKAIFVHGCFWHGHKGCRRATRPKTNKEFWSKKLDGNIDRDRRNLRELRNAGWSVLVIWQCQTKDEIALAMRLKRFARKGEPVSARDKLRKFFTANVGKALTTQQLREVAGISEYGRRIRELRDREGFQIKTHVDRADLKPGEYILETLDQKPVISRAISPQLRNEILERNGFTCQLCGAGPGDTDPFNPHGTVRLHVDHIIPMSQGGSDSRDNLRVLCSACNQGRSNVQPPTETALNIMAKIRKLPKSAQKEIYEMLRKKFETRD